MHVLAPAPPSSAHAAAIEVVGKGALDNLGTQLEGLAGQARVGLRQPGLIRHTIPALQSQKLPQRKGTRAAPFQPVLRVDTLEVVQKVYPMQTVLKHMTRRARHQLPPTILLLSHCHRRIPRLNQDIKKSDRPLASSDNCINGMLCRRDQLGRALPEATTKPQLLSLRAL